MNQREDGRFVMCGMRFEKVSMSKLFSDRWLHEPVPQSHP